MAIVTTIEKWDDADSGLTYTVSAFDQAIENASTGEIDREGARNAIIAAAVTAQGGTLADNYNTQRVSRALVRGTVTWRKESGIIIAGKIGGTFTPPTYPVREIGLNVQVPQSVALSEARKVVQKTPATFANGVTVPTVFDVGGHYWALPQGKVMTFAYPGEAFYQRVTFEGRISDAYADHVRNCAGKLNSDTQLGFPPGHLMLVRATLTQSSAGPESIYLGFAGDKTTRTVTRGAHTLNSVRPWSHVAAYWTMQVINVAAGPETAKNYLALYEQQVFDEVAYAGLFA